MRRPAGRSVRTGRSTAETVAETVSGHASLAVAGRHQRSEGANCKFVCHKRADDWGNDPNFIKLFLSSLSLSISVGPLFKGQFLSPSLTRPFCKTTRAHDEHLTLG